MSYVIQAVLSNPRRPECGQITIPFPIPVDQYDQTIEMLQAADFGFSINRDCAVDGMDSRYNVLNALVGTLVNIDQLDYLAKRLDGFCSGEVSQFQAMAHKLKMTDIKDFINLTFCCQQATVITDFTDLEAVGRSHFINVNGGSARMEELENLDGEETALLLIDGGGGVITPYGVVYDNGMVLEQIYNGHQFPAYDYDNSLMVLEITPKRGLAEGKNPEYLYLPAAEHQIGRTLLRVGITELHDAQVRIDWDELPEKATDALGLEHLSGDDLPALNQMCQAMHPLTKADMVRRREEAPAQAEAPRTMLLTLAVSEQSYPLVLPAAEKQLEHAKSTLGIEDFSQAVIAGVEYVVPYLNRLIPTDCVNVEDANKLALCLHRLKTDGETMKYCAALEVEEPSTFTEALELAIDIGDYELIADSERKYGLVRRLSKPFPSEPEIGQAMV